jgi:hypothetical protein
MKFSTLGGIALAAAMTTGIALAQVKQDMKDAGHDTKAAAVNTGHATRHVAHRTATGTKHVARKTAHGTSVAAKDTAHGTEKLGDKIVGKPAPQ